MARYSYDYREIAGRQRPQGMDPNYRGDYGGMRMHGGQPGQAPYGHYRWRHQGELGDEGGYRGRSLQSRAYTGEWEQGYGGYGQGGGGYDGGMRGGGGVHDPRYDAGFMRDFNAHSPLLHGQGWGSRRYEEEYRGGGSRYDTGYRFGYGNRGLSRSGYSQPWAFGPMRGSPDHR